MEKGFEIRVLDHGYVRYVDSMGSDESIVEAARMSTGRGFVSWEAYRRCEVCECVAFYHPINKVVMVDANGWEFDKRCSSETQEHDWRFFPRGDQGILEYLYSNRHTSPFEMAVLIIDVQVPMDHWRQWIRHRTANVNEYSTRYAEAIDLMAATLPGEWRTQGVTNRQGSGAFLPASSEQPAGLFLSAREAELHRFAREVYEERLKAGVAKEQARKDLLLSTYTAARWKCDLHNILHFLGLRLHEHAQLEIRTFGKAVYEIVKALWPRTIALFEEYDLHGVRLSRTEASFIHDIITRANDGAEGPRFTGTDVDKILAKLKAKAK